MASGPITPRQIEGENVEAVTDVLFLGSKITVDGDCKNEIRRRLFFGRKAMANLDSVRCLGMIALSNKGSYSQGCGLSISHVWMWELHHKEGRMLKNWCFWTVMLEKTFESFLDSKEIKPVNLKEIQPWKFIGRTVALTIAFWPSDANSWLMEKDPHVGGSPSISSPCPQICFLSLFLHCCPQINFSVTFF